jgi:hypothetical protein
LRKEKNAREEKADGRDRIIPGAAERDQPHAAGGKRHPDQKRENGGNDENRATPHSRHDSTPPDIRLPTSREGKCFTDV